MTAPSTPEDDEKQRSTVAQLANAAFLDLRSANAVQVLALVVLIGWLIFEWGPGNEIAIPTLLMGLLNRLDGNEALPIMPIAGFALGFGLQLASGAIAALGFSMLDNTAQAAWLTLRRWRSGTETKNFLTLGWTARWGLAFFVGTTAVVLIQLFTTGEARAWRHMRAVMLSATLVGATIGAISTVVTVAVVLGRRFSAIEPYVDRLVDLLSNPLFWMAVLALGVLGTHLSRRFQRSGRS